MRKYAILDSPVRDIVKVMIYDSQDGCYVFAYRTLEYDAGGVGDDWFPTLEDAEWNCKRVYHVRPGAWIQVSDPMPGCQHDIIPPVRVRGRNLGKPEWGKFERLVEGEWVDFDPPS